MVRKCGAEWNREGMAGGMKGTERLKVARVENDTKQNGGYGTRPLVLPLSDIHPPRGRLFIRALDPVDPSPVDL
jgi:hypothetical protein